MRTRAVLPLVLAALLALPGGTAMADGHVQTVVDFDPAAGEFPEGIATDPTGDLYVSLTFRDEIVKIAPGGNRTVVVTLDPGTRPAGLTVDATGVVYAAATALELQAGRTDPALRGVVRVARDGTASRLPGTEAMTLANDVTLDRRGTVYATDTIDGAVWRIPRGGVAQLWAQHPLLEGNGAFGFGFPIGANGIAIRHDRVVVANAEKGLLVSIPVQPDGSAGQPSILAESPALVGVDGIALDVHGNIYAASGIQNTVMRVLTDDGTIETLATADDGLNQPSTMTFGAGRRDNQHLFIANFSLFVSDPTPGVLTLPTDQPGQPGG
ncbi:MAG: SMP-30/gluconolactonase/LRE family protein [Actinomycetota bacterium]|nr:SMP-30/gluconolactonase/LRE family protein [Actinomycetota bacterium]